MTPEQAKRIDDARRLLQARIDRRAPAEMIDRARRDLAQALEAAKANAQPQATARGGWWDEFWQGEVGSPLPDWQPTTLGPIGKTAAVAEEGRYSLEEGIVKLMPWVVGVPAAVVVGLVLGKALHSKAGRYMARSLIRGAVYRSVGALTR